MAEVSVLLEDRLQTLYARSRRETGYAHQPLLGSIESLRNVLLSPPSEDYQRLCELRRPDLTIEAFILSLENKEQFFSEQELSIARDRVNAGDAIVRSKRIAER